MALYMNNVLQINVTFVARIKLRDDLLFDLIFNKTYLLSLCTGFSLAKIVQNKSLKDTIFRKREVLITFVCAYYIK